MRKLQMTKPIEKFTTEEEFQSLCKWWQHRLGLDYWQIKFTYIENFEGDRKGYYGISYPNHLIRYARIDISDGGCLELTIVHELLHLLTPFALGELETEGSESYIDKGDIFKYNIIHRELELLAKSFILAKYPDIDFNYFMIDFGTFLKAVEEDFSLSKSKKVFGKTLTR